MTRRHKKLVLVVIDSLKPEMLDRALAAGRAPVLSGLIERGSYIRDCVSTFPSVTPVAAATIATGAGPDGHGIPSMNWYRRGEQRYVEYGSSFSASRVFGIFRSLFDTVYNLNMAHLNPRQKTVFECLDDAGFRTACTTYLVYRGRTRHEVVQQGLYPRLARLAQFRHPVWGPRELFYADIYSSQRTGCRSLLGAPGQRDQHAGCVGAFLVENDLFDFLLLSLPDNDTHSHRYGPYAQVESIAGADQALGRMVEAAGGLEDFLDEYGVLVMGDHSQSPVNERLSLGALLDSDWQILKPLEQPGSSVDIAVSPGGRSAMVYSLGDNRAKVDTRLVADLNAIQGVDFVADRVGDVARVRGPGGELRFAPGGEFADERGSSWGIEGDTELLALSTVDTQVSSPLYPDALGRLWQALECPGAGDYLLSAAPGYEFADWGGADHVGGGSHGSLQYGDSLGALIASGVNSRRRHGAGPWSVGDVFGVVLEHFSLPWD